MAKLRDERFLFPGGLSSDSLACLDIIMAKQLPNGACHSILFKLTLAILRQESSEALRRRYVPGQDIGFLLHPCLNSFTQHLTFINHYFQAICFAS